MSAQRIRPEGMGVFGITNGDVAAHPLSEAFASEDAKSTCHMIQNPSALFVVRREERNARQAYPLRYSLQGCFLCRRVLVLRYKLLAVGRRVRVDCDGCGRHHGGQSVGCSEDN